LQSVMSGSGDSGFVAMKIAWSRIGQSVVVRHCPRNGSWVLRFPTPIGQSPFTPEMLRSIPSRLEPFPGHDEARAGRQQRANNDALSEEDAAITTDPVDPFRLGILRDVSGVGLFSPKAPRSAVPDRSEIGPYLGGFRAMAGVVRKPTCRRKWGQTINPP